MTTANAEWTSIRARGAKLFTAKTLLYLTELVYSRVVRACTVLFLNSHCLSDQSLEIYYVAVHMRMGEIERDSQGMRFLRSLFAGFFCVLHSHCENALQIYSGITADPSNYFFKKCVLL